MAVIIAIFFLEENTTQEGLLYREKLAIDFVEGNLTKKNEELNNIKERIKKLSTQ